MGNRRNCAREAFSGWVSGAKGAIQTPIAPENVPETHSRELRARPCRSAALTGSEGAEIHPTGHHFIVTEALEAVVEEQRAATPYAQQQV